jgi:hypothetical protein
MSYPWHEQPETPVRTRLKASAKPNNGPLYFSFPEDFHKKTGTPLNNQAKNIGLQNANSLFSFPLLQQRNQNIKPQHPA